MSSPLPLSIQLYSLRTAGDFDRQLAIAHEAGFRQVELIGSQLDDAAATRATLDARLRDGRVVAMGVGAYATNGRLHEAVLEQLTVAHSVD